MIMYKQYKLPNGDVAEGIIRIKDVAFIPFSTGNTDYANFKKDIMAGGELQDADGAVMTDAQEFVRGLP